MPAGAVLKSTTVMGNIRKIIFALTLKIIITTIESSVSTLDIYRNKKRFLVNYKSKSIQDLCIWTRYKMFVGVLRFLIHRSILVREFQR